MSLKDQSAHIRKEMWEELEKKGVPMTLSWLEWLHERAAVPAITTFMEKSRLLGQSHAVDPEAIGIEPPQEPSQSSNQDNVRVEDEGAQPGLQGQVPCSLLIDSECKSGNS